ncbi:MAG: O-antigen ligase family protein [Deltaproteobacteria bacterium]|nr:O-antigen ligase family protein [Deltaproteobacteria bacterium]
MVKGITYFIIATVGLLFGAVQPWIMSVYAGLMILAFGVLMWQGGRRWRPGVWVWATVGVFLGVTLFQLTPLPHAFLAWVSPVRAEILAQAEALLGAGHAELGSKYTIAYSVNQAFARWGYIVCLALFFWVCVSLGRDRKAYKALVRVAIAYGGVAAVYGLLQVLIPSVGVWWVPPDFAYPGCARGTYINRNSFAGLMEMLWPLALGVTLAQGEWESRKGVKAALSDDQVNAQLIRFLLVALMVVALLFSRSRAGIVGAFVGMAALLWLIRQVSGEFRWGVRIAVMALAALVVIYGASIGFDRIMERFFQIESGAEGRMDIWAQTWDMVKDHPFGVGLGNFQVLEPVYVDPGRPGISYRLAHNDYLQFLVEAGWVGALALVAGFFLFLIRSIRRVRRIGFEVGRSRLMVSIGALAGLCSMAFHGFFDFNFQIPANQVFFVLLLALVEAGLWPERARSRRSGVGGREAVVGRR